MSRRILAAVAAVVIVAAAMGVRYLVVSADASAGAARAGADHLLKGIDSDTMQVDRTLAAPLFPNMRARDPNFGIRKQAFDAHVERIGQARSLVAVDQGKLRSAGDTLRVRRANLLALTERSTLDRELGRVAAMRSALDEADAALLVERDQSRTLSAVCDALADTDTMFMRFGDADYVGAVAMFSGVDLKLQTAADLARSNSVPAPVDLLVRDVRAFVDDLEAALQAISRHDARAVRPLTDKLDADGQRLNALDVAQIDSLDRGLVALHSDWYHRHLRAAGFTPAA